MTDTIPVGTHWVEAPCPRCGALEVIGVHLASVLTTPQDEIPSLRVRAKAKPVDHDCRQFTLSLDEIRARERTEP